MLLKLILGLTLDQTVKWEMVPNAYIRSPVFNPISQSVTPCRNLFTNPGLK